MSASDDGRSIPTISGSLRLSTVGAELVEAMARTGKACSDGNVCQPTWSAVPKIAGQPNLGRATAPDTRKHKDWLGRHTLPSSTGKVGLSSNLKGLVLDSWLGSEVSAARLHCGGRVKTDRTARRERGPLSRAKYRRRAGCLGVEWLLLMKSPNLRVAMEQEARSRKRRAGNNDSRICRPEISRK